MPLASGERLGPYEILTLIGKGGMGEVYKARDTRLGRDVAIKVSAQQFSERFDREARVVASLNHPNICTLFDVGPNYLVMEYIEGHSPKGPMPLEEALGLARQIVEALREAHEKNITHRDLKPANIKIKPDGSVKVLDFGLAKVGRTATSDGDATLTIGATATGSILGTPAYMAPEQARGQETDRRSDIWAFGVVLHELLTAERMFTGDTVSDVLAGVLKSEPDLSTVPVEVRRLLKRCLEKDPKKRLQHIGDVWDLLDSNVAVGQTVLPSVIQKDRRRDRLSYIATAAAVAALGALAYVHYNETSPEPQVLNYTIEAPEKTIASLSVVSPDGSQVVIRASGGRASQLWVRPLDSLDARLLPGTDGAAYPFWSPNSRDIAFFANGELKKISVAGGPAVTLCAAPQGRGGSWNEEGVIIFGNNGGDIQRVAMAGGVPIAVTKGDALAGDRFPVFLPDGRRFYYLVSTGKEPGIYVASLDAKPEEKPQRVVLDHSNPQYLPPNGDATVGHLLFVREGTLMAQPLDPETLQLAGDVFPVAERIGAAGAGDHYIFSASLNGVLIHQPGSSQALRQLTWVDKTGKKLSTLNAPHLTGGLLALSPDGKRVVADRRTGVERDLWMTEVERSTESRFTFDAGEESSPVWAPDGSRVAFTSIGEGKQPNLYQRAANGTGQSELLLDAGVPAFPSDWTRDGKYILFRGQSPATKYDLYAFPVTGDKKPIPLLISNANEVMGTVSPDGRWLAYASDENGNFEVYIQPFTPGKPSTGKWQISLGDGRDPHWRGDSKELFYVTQTGKMMAVDIKAVGASVERGTPHELFDMLYPTSGNSLSRYGVTADGQRFIMAAEPESTEASPIYVTVNWLAGVKK